MTTYLLAWNPKRSQWDDLAELSSDVKAGKRTVQRWSCGTSKLLRKGERAFLIRLGQEPKGIFASGTISKGSYSDSHWEAEKAAIGETGNFVQVELDTLLDPKIDSILPRKRLDGGQFSEMHWDTQMSGVRIPVRVAEKLEKVWADFAQGGNTWLPEEVTVTEGIFEGALDRITVDAYERNPEARRKCIEHYGTNCIICGFSFAARYGQAGKGFIHIHHLRQLAEIGKEYEIDPIRDLRPVCPNCHAMIHKKREGYTIEEMKLLLRQARNG